MKPKRKGRPRDKNAERTASGRKSRARQPKEDPRKVAMEARERVYGVSKGDAAQPHASTVLGRLYLSGIITEAMREAGERYLALHSAAMRAIKAPVGLAVTNSAGDGGDVVTEDYVTWAIKAVAHYEVMKSALGEFPARLWVVERVVIEDREVPICWRIVCRNGLAFLAKRMRVGESANAA